MEEMFMRRMNCLAGIMAAVLLFQTPLVVNAGYVDLSCEEDLSNENIKESEGENSYYYEPHDDIVVGESDLSIGAPGENIPDNATPPTPPAAEGTDGNSGMTPPANGDMGDIDAPNSEIGKMGNEPDAAHAGNGYTLIVDANVSVKAGTGSGACADNNGTLIVHGDATSVNGHGACAESGGSVYVDGDAKSTEGNAITDEFKNTVYTGAGAYASGEGSEVYVGNSAISANNAGAYAYNGGYVKVDGNAVSENGQKLEDNNGNSFYEGAGALASKDGIVEVGGNATSKDGNGVKAIDGGIVNVIGDAVSENGNGVFVKAGTVYVGGDVKSTNAIGANVLQGGSLIVDGSVVSDEYTAMIINNDCTVDVGQDVVSKAYAVWLTSAKDSDTQNGYVIVDGTIKSESNSALGYELLATKEDTYDNLLEYSDNLQEDILKYFPNVYTSELVAGEGHNYVNVGGTEDWEKEQLNELFESILTNKVFYMIDDTQTEGITIANKAEITRKLDDNVTLVAASENDDINITVNDGYVLSMDGVTPNDDGTYTIRVKRGEGFNYIKVEAIKKALEDCGVTVGSVEENDDEVVIVVENPYATLQKDIQNKISSIPTNGTLEISAEAFGNIDKLTNAYVSINKKTMEAIAARPDVAVTVIYKFNGKLYKTVIPAGYSVLDLLDENGYCGCLYLNAIFGSELIG
jgi:hypothetical protein